MSFNLSIHPWMHVAKYHNGKWKEEYIEKEHLSFEEERERNRNGNYEITNKRNSFEQFPLVNYSTQYALSCFEGLKAYPQQDGSLKLF